MIWPCTSLSALATSKGLIGYRFCIADYRRPSLPKRAGWCSIQKSANVESSSYQILSLPAPFEAVCSAALLVASLISISERESSWPLTIICKRFHTHRLIRTFIPSAIYARHFVWRAAFLTSACISIAEINSIFNLTMWQEFVEFNHCMYLLLYSVSCHIGPSGINVGVWIGPIKDTAVWSQPKYYDIWIFSWAKYSLNVCVNKLISKTYWNVCMILKRKGILAS